MNDLKIPRDLALKDWGIKLHKIRRMRPHVLSVARGTSARAEQCRAEAATTTHFPSSPMWT